MPPAEGLTVLVHDYLHALADNHYSGATAFASANRADAPPAYASTVLVHNRNEGNRSQFPQHGMHVPDLHPTLQIADTCKACGTDALLMSVRRVCEAQGRVRRLAVKLSPPSCVHLCACARARARPFSACACLSACEHARARLCVRAGVRARLPREGGGAYRLRTSLKHPRSWCQASSLLCAGCVGGQVGIGGVVKLADFGELGRLGGAQAQLADACSAPEVLRKGPPPPPRPCPDTPPSRAPPHTPSLSHTDIPPPRLHLMSPEHGHPPASTFPVR